MKFRVILKRNENALCTFGTYFKTKKEAKEYAKQFDDAIVQKKLVENWVVCH